MRIGLLFSCVTLLLIAGCASSTYYVDISKLEEDYEITIPSSDDQSEHDAVVILKRNDWFLLFDPYMGVFHPTFTARNISLINRNIDKYSSVIITIDPEYESLNWIHARVICPDGEIVELKDDEFIKQQGSISSMSIHDNRDLIKFVYPNLKKGSIVEYSYQKDMKVPFMGENTWIIQEDIPILANVFTITLPMIFLKKNKIQWKYKAYNYPGLSQYSVLSMPTFSEYEKLKDLACIQWFEKDVPALEHEPSMPPGLSAIPHMVVAPLFAGTSKGEWSDVSKHYMEQCFLPNFEITNKVIAKAHELTHSLSSDQEKMAACFDYVKKLRYVSIHFGESGITPRKPEEVLDSEYGDCKNKSMLLFSLLKAIKIEASPVLLQTNDSGFFDQQFPSICSFNHMMIKATLSDGNSYWLDPTCEFCTIHTIPAHDQFVNCLVLHEDGTSEIELIPGFPADNNQRNVYVDFDLSEHNVLSIEIESRGEYYLKSKYSLKDKTEDEVKDMLAALLNDTVSKDDITDIETTEREEDRHFVIKTSFKVKDNPFVKKQGDLTFIDYNFISQFPEYNHMHEDERKFPYYFGNLRKTTVYLNVHYNPDEMRLYLHPEEMLENRKKYEYSVSSSQKEGEFSLVKKLVIKNYTLSPNEFPDFRELFKKATQNESEQIVLKSILSR